MHGGAQHLLLRERGRRGKGGGAGEKKGSEPAGRPFLDCFHDASNTSGFGMPPLIRRDGGIVRAAGASSRMPRAGPGKRFPGPAGGLCRAGHFRSMFHIGGIDGVVITPEILSDR
ncbi:hypothetical protein STVA_36390 [Allostella vacuolata]|nr:hypothetical protein STVA_36390 [Stella vacuolata]